MSMSTYVVVFKSPDKEHEKMRQIYENCQELGIPIPDLVLEYFEDCSDDWQSIGIPIDTSDDAVQEWKCDMKDGYLVDLSKLPKEAGFVLFYNSY